MRYLFNITVKHPTNHWQRVPTDPDIEFTPSKLDKDVGITLTVSTVCKAGGYNRVLTSVEDSLKQQGYEIVDYPTAVTTTPEAFVGNIIF